MRISDWSSDVCSSDLHATISGGQRSGTEALRGSLRIAPIALRHQRASMNQFPRFVVRRRAAIRAHDKDFGERNGRSHAVWMTVDQRGFEICCAKGLRQTQHWIQIEIGREVLMERVYQYVQMSGVAVSFHKNKKHKK